MPVFDTPEPISVTILFIVGDAHITAGDRRDTVVEVRPSDASAEIDVRAAEQTIVGYADGRLLIKTPKQRGLGLFGKPGSVDVTIALPAGSRVQGEAGVGSFTGVGRLGQCRFKSGTGDIQLEHTGTLDLHTAGGAVRVDRVVGDAQLSTGTGRVRVQEIDGTAVIKNANGDCWVGTVTGDLRVNAANGDITVERPRASVKAVTANGDVRIGEVLRGSVSIKTACGELEVGIRPGTAALLDVHTQFGSVRNGLAACDAPAGQDETAEVRARSGYGDILIHRSAA